MIPRQHPSVALLRLAELQAGVLSTEQAVGHGTSRRVVERLVADQQWSRLGPGLLHVQTTPPSWLGLAWAGVLAGGDEARLGGAAAAHLYGFETEPPRLITVLVPWTTRPRDRGPWRFRRERPGVRLPRSVGAPPRTGVEDTVLDLCDGADEPTMVSWVTAASSKGLTTPSRLRLRLDARGQLTGRRVLASLLTEVPAGIESPLELRYLRDVERAHGLPVASRQVRRLRHRSDVSYEECGVLVELDGKLGHDGMGRFRDMRRDNAFAVTGRTTLRYGWGDVASRPCEVARQIAEVLRRRGWSGRPHRCPRCRHSNLWTL